MIRNTLIAFISGWIIWFWIDKPRAGLMQFLQADDSMLINFQRAFDLLKSGYPAQSFIYIWNAHYIILSLLAGILLSVIYGFISDILRRKRMRRFMTPELTRQQEENNKKPENDLS